jgi:hypothetical protein
MTLMFKDVVEKILEGKFAYANGQPQKTTISKIIAEKEGKEFVPPVYDVLLKTFWNSFVVSEDARTEALKKWPNSVMAPVEKQYVVKDPYALYHGNWYIYLEEGINVGYIYVAIAYGNVPILPSFFKDEFGECAVYYNAELIYPHYRFSLTELYKAIASVFKNERLYFSKINCLVERNQLML